MKLTSHPILCINYLAVSSLIFIPHIILAYFNEQLTVLVGSSGVIFSVPSAYFTNTGSTVNYFLQYYENNYTVVVKDLMSFIYSVPVDSIKQFFILSVIFECSPLMIGGRDKTTPF